MSDTTVAAPERRDPRVRRGLLFPAVLIILGAVFLLGNLGYIPPVSLRAVAQLWPLILIVLGIEAILGRREPVLALAVELGVILLAVALVAAQPAGLFAPTSRGSTDASVEREGAASLALRVSGGAGSYTISGGATALVEARSEGAELRVRTERRGSGADVRVDPAVGVSGDGPRFDLFRFNGGPPIEVRVRVANDVPASIRLEGGAGDFTLDMRDLIVTDARVATGASSLHVVLPAPRGDVSIRIEAGAASIDIEVPDGVEARIGASGGALSTSVTNPRFGGGTGASLVAVGRSMQTSGYAGAKDRVTVTIEAGASSITIR